jgi:hypothetical protein
MRRFEIPLAASSIVMWRLGGLMGGMLLVIEIIVTIALAIVAILAGNVRYEPQKRPWLDGIAAAIIASLVLVGVAAGTTRTCMPNLDWDIFFGQMALRGVLETFLLPILVLPAFAVAWRIAPKRDLVGAFILIAYALSILIFVVVTSRDVGGSLQTGGSIVAIFGMAAAIGFLYNRTIWMRRFGVLIGVFAGTLAGIIIFASLPFGKNDCWP